MPVTGVRACRTWPQRAALDTAGSRPRHILHEPALLVAGEVTTGGADLALDLIGGLRPTLELLRRKSPRLHRQLEGSLAGIVQDVCEDSGRAGDR